MVPAQPLIQQQTREMEILHTTCRWRSVQDICMHTRLQLLKALCPKEGKEFIVLSVQPASLPTLSLQYKATFNTATGLCSRWY